jgi:hypothetical protein
VQKAANGDVIAGKFVDDEASGFGLSEFSGEKEAYLG